MCVTYGWTNEQTHRPSDKPAGQSHFGFAKRIKDTIIRISLLIPSLIRQLTTEILLNSSISVLNQPSDTSTYLTSVGTSNSICRLQSYLSWRLTFPSASSPLQSGFTQLSLPSSCVTPARFSPRISIITFFFFTATTYHNSPSFSSSPGTCPTIP